MKLSDYIQYYKYDKETGENKPCGLGFVKHGVALETYYHQISKEEYDAYYAMSAHELSAAIEKTLDKSIICGYGYYGAKLYEDTENNLYFVGYTCGKSCD